MKSRERLIALTASAALAFGLAACSDGDSNEPTSAGNSTPTSQATATDGTTPACGDLWVDGATLPTSYDGCTDGDSLVAAVTIDCADGTKFTTYDDRFYAVIGSTVHANIGEPADDPAYSKAYDDCLGN